MPKDYDDYDDRRNEHDDYDARRDEPRSRRRRRGEDDEDYDDRNEQPRSSRRGRDIDYDDDRPRQKKLNTMALLSFIFGLGFCILGPLSGVIAPVLGVIGLVQLGKRPYEKGKGMAIAGIILGIIGFATIPALLYSVQKVRGAATRTKSLNNLKLIGIGLHDYHTAMNTFPPAIGVSEKNKRQPTLSWRVAILPYIEQGALYDQFHLDEAWDSPHNIKLLDRMPLAYQRPGSTNKGMTPYRVFIGGGAIFGSKPGEKSATLADISQGDGANNTLLVVESREEVPWTKPDELEYSPNKPLPALGETDRGFGACFADGSVLFLESPDEAAIRAAITYNGKEPNTITEYRRGR